VVLDLGRRAAAALGLGRGAAAELDLGRRVAVALELAIAATVFNGAPRLPFGERAAVQRFLHRQAVTKLREARPPVAWSTLVDLMAARTIVTSHPDVACDVCGRRLLRGEQPEAFIGGGQRRLVCELCTSRATHEGWRRETDALTTKPRSESQRGRSLLGGLRQLRWPTIGSVPAIPAARPGGAGGRWAHVEEELTAPTESWSAAPAVAAPPGAIQPAAADHTGVDSTDVDPTGVDPHAGVRRALEVFNAGEHPRRLAGVARALGAPTVRATRPEGTHVAIVVAWELCWYRYEIDPGDEAQGAWLAAEGMELAELPGEDRVANAVVDERGEIALMG
jgi:hypothetical protein